MVAYTGKHMISSQFISQISVEPINMAHGRSQNAANAARPVHQPVVAVVTEVTHEEDLCKELTLQLIPRGGWVTRW